MKITVRIPTEAYAFQEVVFDSLEEYKNEFINFVEVYKKLKANLADTSKNDLPFEKPKLKDKLIKAKEIVANNPLIMKK